MKSRNLSLVGLIGLSILLSACGTNGTSSSALTSSSLSSGSTSSGLSFYANSSVVSPNGSTALYASGGTAPYTYTLSSGAGSVSGNVYYAGSTIGSATILVTDSVGNTASTYISVENTLTLTLGSSTVSTGGTVTLSASGGTAPYTYSITSGGGTISGSTFKAPAYATVVEIEATDAGGLTGTATITVNYISAIQITPSSTSLFTGSSLALSASGGTGSYNYALVSGAGSLSGSTYTAPSSATVAKVEVWDSAGNTATATINVVALTTLSTTGQIMADNSAFLVFNMPNNNTLFYPSFALGGASGAGNGGIFGWNVAPSANQSALAFAPPSSSAAVALTNFLYTDSSPYTGELVITDRSGAGASFSFCFQQGNPTAYLKKVSVSGSPLSLVVSFSAISYPILAQGTSGGINEEGLWLAVTWWRCLPRVLWLGKGPSQHEET